MTISPSKSHTLLSYGLILTLIMLFIMVILGGATRLTGSGLSMVEWQPITGFIPPTSLEDWQRLFAQYQAFPEFQKVNAAMDLEGFKSIFWLEFIHRLWGRLMGVLFLGCAIIGLIIPTLRRFAPRLILIWLLGAAQGALGWYMVKSGLMDQPHVSPYRLSAHLSLAFLTFALVLWTWLDLRARPKTPLPAPLRRLIWIGLGLFTTTMIYGGFVAGLKAGLVYNTFPTMNGQWVPMELFTPAFKALNLLTEPSCVQWVHRCLAILTVLCVCIFQGYTASLTPLQRRWIHVAVGAVVIQFALGIITLLTHLNMWMALVHQAWALVLCGVLVRLAYETKIK